MLISSQPTLRVEDLFRADLKLASPPNVYFALKSVIDNPGASMTDAVKIIEDDAALTVKLLKIVNSAFFGFPSEITSLDRAVTLIGLQELQNLVFSSVVIERFSDLPGNIMTMHDFWAKNLRCALLCREFDRSLGNRHADSAFICGLIHNIGHLVFFRTIPLLAREVCLLMQSQTIVQLEDEFNLEQRIIGFDHFVTGAELCRLWKLPEVIIESIRQHTEPLDCSPHAQLAALVRLAHGLTYLELSAEQLANISPGLSAEQISAALNNTAEAFQDIFRLFYPLAG